MTREEIKKIPFKFVSHLNVEGGHTTTSYAEYKGHVFLLCDHAPVKEIDPFGRRYRHYTVDGKEFKSKEKFYQYCETLEEIEDKL